MMIDVKGCIGLLVLIAVTGAVIYFAGLGAFTAVKG